ncbi:MAG: FtsW/RodA/SpoVE family cell cycle protein, partial [Coprobacillus sp.]
LGLIGFMLFLIPYCIIIYKMFNYAMKIQDVKSKLILYGVGIYFFTHLLVNIGGVSGLIPMTGVPLLLISSGGSSTWAAMIALGIAQSIIAKYNRDTLKEQI